MLGAPDVETTSYLHSCCHRQERMKQAQKLKENKEMARTEMFEALFKMMDQNQDGLLTKTEVALMAKAAGKFLGDPGATSNPEVLNKMFAAMDTNHDGLASLSEGRVPPLRALGRRLLLPQLPLAVFRSTLTPNGTTGILRFNAVVEAG